MTFPGVDTNIASPPSEPTHNAVPVTVPGDFEQSNAEAAQTTADQVAEAVLKLREDAGGIAAEALEYIEFASNFSPEALSVSYNPPDYDNAAFHSVQPGDTTPPPMPYVAAPARPQQGTAGDRSVDTVETPAYDPAVTGIPTASKVERVDMGAPKGPFVTDVSFDVPPKVETELSEVELPGAPKANDICPFPSFPPLPEVLELDELDTSEVDAALAVLTERVYSPLDFTPYQSVVPDAYAVVGAMLNGLPEDVDALADGVFARGNYTSGRVSYFLSGLLSDRGLADKNYGSAVSAYNHRLSEILLSERTDRVAAQKARQSASALLAGVRIGASVYTQTISNQNRLLQAQITSLASTAQSLQSWLDSVQASYRASSIAIESLRLQHMAVMESEEAIANRHRSEVAVEISKASSNRAEADAFVAEERNKRVGLQVSEAEYRAHRSKLQAFDAKVRASIGQAQQLESRALSLRARIAEWSARASRVRGQYQAYDADARYISAANQAATAVLATNAGDNRSVAAIAQQIAQQANMELGALQVSASNEQVSQQYDIAVNRLNEVLARLSASRYSAVSAGTSAQFSAAGVEPRSHRYQDVESSRFFVAAAEAASRAATLTQNANIQLSEAYSTVQTAVGRASAAVEAGRLSGWKATATLNATGTLSAGVSASRSQGKSYQTSTTESDSVAENTTIKSGG